MMHGTYNAKKYIYLTSIILFLLSVRHNFYLVIVILIYIYIYSLHDGLKICSSPIPPAPKSY